MTWTYDTSLSTSRDKVRLLVGDTDTNDQQLSDEEITFITSEETNVYRAAALASRTLAAKYARLVGSSVESLRFFASDRFDHYTQLARQLEEQASKVSGSSVGSPVITGISIDAIESVEDDTDRVGSAFKKGQFHNPPYSQTRDLNADC